MIQRVQKKTILKGITKDKLYNEYNRKLKISYPLKENYDSIVPLNIYQTWHTKNLSPKMFESINLIKNLNPRFNYQLFDDNDCREFIKNNFEPNVLHAFNSLIPGAYKADLWRLCILFINGGIYLDIKLCCVNGFRLIELTENNHFVKDRPNNAVFNSLMVSQKGNIFLYKAIRQIVENVKNKFYGNSPLSPTGPELLGDVIIKNNLNVNIDLIHYEYGGYIVYKNIFVISTEYPEYDTERKKLYDKLNTKRYDKLWESRQIYR